MAPRPKQSVKAEQFPDPEPEFQPKTELGRRLWELRKQIVASGDPLLDWNDLEREIAERRGGTSASPEWGEGVEPGSSVPGKKESS